MVGFFGLAKYRGSSLYSFQRRGEPGIHRHLQNDLEDLVGSAADVQRAADMVLSTRPADSPGRSKRPR
jgi:hypothetical protein